MKEKGLEKYIESMRLDMQRFCEICTKRRYPSMEQYSFIHFFSTEREWKMLTN